MKHVMVVLFCSLLCVSAAEAQRFANSSPAFVQTCPQSDSCNLMLFGEVTKLYRPSKEETHLANYVESLKNVAERFIWKKRLWFQRDALGNMVIRVPATGKFAYAPHAKPVALQAHMDMVLAYAGAQPGEDIRKYFINGVTTEITDGWIHSKDNKTTLGADNGIGVAFALRFLLDPKLVHPPLELIFTVQEETGLTGALAMQIPVLSRTMLCLDGMAPQPGLVIAGSQGGMSAVINGQLKGESEPDGSVRVKITVTGLAGGHSGANIHLKRLNAMKGFAEVYRTLALRRISEMRLASVVVGNIGIRNQIPNLMEAVLSIPKAQAPGDLAARIETRFKELVSALPDENKNYELKVEITDAPAGGQVATLAQSVAFIKGILEAPNGVITTDPAFPNQVKTSSNLGFWGLVNSEGTFSSTSSVFTRSFDANELKPTFDKVASTVMTPLAPFGTFKIEAPVAYPPWIVPKTSKLLKLVLSLDGFTGTYVPAVGLEPSAFMQKFPDMDVVALAPHVLEAHTVNERMEVASVETAFKSITKVLEAQ